MPHTPQYHSPRTYFKSVMSDTPQFTISKKSQPVMSDTPQYYSPRKYPSKTCLVLHSITHISHIQVNDAWHFTVSFTSHMSWSVTLGTPKYHSPHTYTTVRDVRHSTVSLTSHIPQSDISGAPQYHSPHTYTPVRMSGTPEYLVPSTYFGQRCQTLHSISHLTHIPVSDVRHSTVSLTSHIYPSQRCQALDSISHLIHTQVSVVRHITVAGALTSHMPHSVVSDTSQ